MNGLDPQPDTTTPTAPVEVFWGVFVANVPGDRDGRRFAMILKECGRRHGMKCTDFGSFSVPTAKEARSCRSVRVVQAVGAVEGRDEGVGV